MEQLVRLYDLLTSAKRLRESDYGRAKTFSLYSLVLDIRFINLVN